MLTKSEQLLLLEIFLKKEIKKKDQNIYKSQKFYKTISKLKNFELVKAKNNSNECIYSLTFKGWVRADCIAQDKNTPEKYAKLAKTIVVFA